MGRGIEPAPVAPECMFVDARQCSTEGRQALAVPVVDRVTGAAFEAAWRDPGKFVPPRGVFADSRDRTSEMYLVVLARASPIWMTREASGHAVRRFPPTLAGEGQGGGSASPHSRGSQSSESSRPSHPAFGGHRGTAMDEPARAAPGQAFRGSTSSPNQSGNANTRSTLPRGTFASSGM